MNMNDDTKQCLIVCGSIVAVFCSLIWSIFIYNEVYINNEMEIAKTAMENGYVQVEDSRSSYRVLWVKAEE